MEMLEQSSYLQALAFGRKHNTDPGTGPCVQEFYSMANQMSPQARHLTSLYLSVSICKVGKIVVSD